MQDWMAPVFGTALGLSLVAAAAVLVLPERPMIDIAPMVQRVLRSAPPPDSAAPKRPVPATLTLAPPPAPPAAAAPRPLPRFAPVPPPVPVPRAVEAEQGVGVEGLLRRAPDGWSTGTGFFVTSRGTILSAAHVVQGCAGVRVMSAHMRPENARVIATDTEHDIAVLEVAGLDSPAWLPVGASRGAGRMVVLGFPAGAMPDMAHETWAGLANGAFAAGAPFETDPARLLWFRSGDVAPGYSGGPVVDVASGRVVGMVRGGIDSRRVPLLHGVGTAGLALGPGAAPLLAMMSRWIVREGVVPAGLGVESALEMTRRATVRVVCTR